MSIRLDFDQSSITGLQQKLESEYRALIKTAAVATGKVIVARAKQGPFKDHTRQLRSNIHYLNLGVRGGYYQVQIVSPMFYSSFVEKGTPPHDIWPKAAHNAPTSSLMPGQSRRARGKGPHEHIVGRGLALRWKNAAGQEFFAAMVHHRGSKPYPFFAPAMDYGRIYLTQFIQRGFEGISLRLESHA